MPSALSASRSLLIGRAEKSSGQPSPYSVIRRPSEAIKAKFGRLFSEAPTVLQYFAVAGEPTEPGEPTPLPLRSLPSLPAAKQITRSRWVLTKSSTSLQLAV